MSVLFCRNLEIEVAGSTLLDKITFRLEQGEKAGLVGANGAGKTTLLKAIMGEIPIEKGEIDRPPGTGYLPQTATEGLMPRGQGWPGAASATEGLMPRGQGWPGAASATEGLMPQGHTVFQAMLAERQDILDMRDNLRFLEIRMAQAADEKILEQYSRLTERYEQAGGYALEAQTRKILAGLGFADDHDTAIGTLSGGQKTRLALGKLLLRQPELLILDEPTNHLDIEALEWLENYLEEYAGSVLVVSHDRYFLDKVAGRIFLLQDGSLHGYSGNYTEFELQRTVEELTLAREAERVNKKIADLEAYIRRFGAGIKAKQARGRESQLKKITPVTVPKTVKSLQLDFGPQTRAGDKVLNLDEVAVAFGEQELFRDVSLELRRGDRVALLGKNGIGKTTLLRAILGQIPYQGAIRLGVNVSIGYFSQEHEDIGLRDTVIDEIRYSTKYEDPQIRNILAGFGFRGDDVFKPLQILSGGEKSRLALCKLFLAKGNLLLLDEPTNHLDMDTREMLEEALLDYDGTILTVSHDRYFLNRVVNKIAVLTPAGLRTSEGDYAAYREVLENEKTNAAEPAGAEDGEFSSARSYQEESRNNRRREKKIKQLEEKITQTEELLKANEAQMELMASDYEQTIALNNEREQLQEELDSLMEEWLAFLE